MYETDPCTETVSILEAIVLGAGEACVNVNPVSVLTALIPFVIAVVVLQIAANRMVARLRGRPGAGTGQAPLHDAPAPRRDGPIRSNRSM